MDFYNVNVFKSAGDPSSLIESIEWAHVKFPVLNITHAPTCLLFSSDIEKKDIAFCFENEGILSTWQIAAEMFKLCRKGIDPKSISKLQIDCIINSINNGNNKNSTNDPFQNLPSLLNKTRNSGDDSICPNCPKNL